MGDPETLAALGELGGRGPALAPPLAPPLPGPAEVEITWQEILSLSELQGLDVSTAPPFPPAPPAPVYPPAAPPRWPLPLPPEALVALPAESFRAALGRARLSGAEVALARDMRRRAKNKVAAQRCRRRKLEAIAGLREELGRLGRERERLLRVRGGLRRDLARVAAMVRGAMGDGGALDNGGDLGGPRSQAVSPAAALSPLLTRLSR
ncbi:transcription factor NF-E2 45 kDa subunit [Caloenas nicobarica]|uniref:transcription factor NF-E2 45 kDa subunit n=1 Tax=Caloenas nicobarica TaxID=187106 RepID=UPI0032B742CC